MNESLCLIRSTEPTTVRCGMIRHLSHSVPFTERSPLSIAAAKSSQSIRYVFLYDQMFILNE